MTAPLMIPKLIHRIGLAGRCQTKRRSSEPSGRRCTRDGRLHAARVDLPAPRNQHWFDAAPSPAARADIARLELLHRFGGVYVDTDMQPLRPLDDLVASTPCFLGREDSRWIGTGIIGATPHHPFITELVDRLGESIRSKPASPPNEVSGPKFVTAVYNSLRATEKAKVAIFPPELFYPYHFSEPERAGESFPDVYAVHHWSMSWVKTSPDHPGTGDGGDAVR